MAQTQPGTFWIDAGVAHLRDAEYLYDVTGDALCAGSITIQVNFNLDLVEHSGALWGTAVSELDASDGGWVSSWNAHWTSEDPLAPDATDIWMGGYVARGYGDLAGWQGRAMLHEATHSLVHETGYAFVPGR